MRFTITQVSQLTGLPAAQLKYLLKNDLAQAQPKKPRQHYRFSYTDTLKLLAISVLSQHFGNHVKSISNYIPAIDAAIGDGDATMSNLIEFEDRNGKALVLDVNKLRDRLDGRVRSFAVQK